MKYLVIWEVKPEDMGKVAEKWILPDHIGPTGAALSLFAQKCVERGCDIIVCSEKDWVKLPMDQELPLPLGYLKAEMEVVTGKEHYETLLSRIGKLTPEREVS